MRIATDRSDDGPRNARKPRKETDGVPAWSGPCGQERHTPDRSSGPLSCFSWSIIRSVRPHAPSSSPQRAHRFLRTSHFSFSERVVVAEKSRENRPGHASRRSKSTPRRRYRGPSYIPWDGLDEILDEPELPDRRHRRPARPAPGAGAAGREAGETLGVAGLSPWSSSVTSWIGDPTSGAPSTSCGSCSAARPVVRRSWATTTWPWSAPPGWMAARRRRTGSSTTGPAMTAIRPSRVISDERR